MDDFDSSSLPPALSRNPPMRLPDASRTLPQRSSETLEESDEPINMTNWRNVVSKGPFTRLKKEFQEMTAQFNDSWLAGPVGDDLLKWVAAITGPVGTPYEGGTFYVEINIPKAYPFAAPIVSFRSRIYHCNIDPKTCLPNIDLLKTEWRSACTLADILNDIVAIMKEPRPHQSAVEAIALQYLTDRAQYDRMAQTWTTQFAR